MKYTYVPNNRNYFATNLKNLHGKLRWDTNIGGTTLVFRGRFGEDILPEMDEICKKLGSMENHLNEEFVSLSPEFPYLSALILDPRQKARQGGCIIKDEVSRYTVLACRVTEEECTIFEPRRAYTVDIPAEISVFYEKIYDSKKISFFRLKKEKEEFSGFYKVMFEDNNLSAYKNGDIYYVVNDIHIPVTSSMIEADGFYIKTETMPVLATKNDGFHITIKEIQWEDGK